MKFGLYAFDFDLTAADTVKVSCEVYKRSFASIGATFRDETIFYHLTRDISVSFRETDDGTHDYAAFLKTFEDLSKELFDKVTLYPDVIPAIERIKASGAKTALITNRHIDSVERAMEKYGGAKKYFDYMITGDITENFKPHPEPVLKCLKVSGVDKSDFIYYGDAENDYLSANAAGVDFVFVDRTGAVDKAGAIKTFDEIE